MEEYPQERVVATRRGRRRCVLGTLAICFFLAGLESTMMTNTAPAIAKALDAPLWTSTALGTIYLLASAVCQPVAAQISHVVGRKCVAVVFLLVYIAGTVVAGTARSIAQVCVGRVLQGIGGGGQSAMPTLILNDMFYLRERASIASTNNAVGAVGNLLGPLLGGLITDHLDWPYIFWCQTGISGVLLALMISFLPLDTQPGSLMGNLKKVDWMSTLSTAAITCLLTLPLLAGGSLYPWSDWRIILPFCLAGAALLPYIYHQRSHAHQPVFGGYLFRSWIAVVGFFLACSQALELFLALYAPFPFAVMFPGAFSMQLTRARQYMAVLYQAALGMPSLETALRALPAFLGYIVALVCGGCVSARTRSYGWASRAGGALSTLGFGCLLRVDERTPAAELVGVSLLLGVGFGLGVSATSSVTQREIHPDHKKQASAALMFLRGIGQALGVALGGTIYSNVLAARLDATPGLRGGVSLDNLMTTLKDLAPGDPRKAALRTATLDALDADWIFGCVLSGVLLLVVLPIRFKKLPKVHRNKETPAEEVEMGVKGSASDSGEPNGVTVAP